MTDIMDANLTHSFFLSSVHFASTDEFVRKAMAFDPNAIIYDLNKDCGHPYLAEMQTAENFLHGGGQTYEVKRVLFSRFVPDMEKAGLAGWCVLMSYFPESDVMSISFHYAVKSATTDALILLRQSGEHKLYPFADGERSATQLAGLICGGMGIEFHPVERSYLCEITRFGDYDSVAAIEQEQAGRLYGIITGDEGYSFASDTLVRERLKTNWGSREFIRIYAFGQSFLFLNLLDSSMRRDYLAYQQEFGARAYGGCNPYFTMGSCPLTVNHGIFFSVEFAMMLKTLISGVMEASSVGENGKERSFYRRIRETRRLRHRIITVLEKVESTEISEIGELSAVLMESQHIVPIVDHVKYLLELLEGDLDLLYSERNNLLMTILTVIGLVFALLEIALK